MPKIQKWEYCMVESEFDSSRCTIKRSFGAEVGVEETCRNSMEIFTLLGQEGWELVHVDERTSYFKRPIAPTSA